MNVNASSTRSVPNQTYLQPCGPIEAAERVGVPRCGACCSPRPRRPRRSMPSSSAVRRPPRRSAVRRPARGSDAAGCPAAACADRGEPVPDATGAAAPVPDVDRVPAGERVGDLQVGRVVRVAQRAERLLGEHHAPAERGVRARCVPRTVDLVAGSAFRSRIARYSPAGPAPTIETRIRPPPRPDRSSSSMSDTVGSRISSSQPSAS